MADEGERPEREQPLGSRTRGPGQPAPPPPGAVVAPTTPAAPAPMLARQVALAAERQAVAVRRLRWREAIERRRTDATPTEAVDRDDMPTTEPDVPRVATSAVLRALLARTVRRVRHGLGLDET